MSIRSNAGSNCGSATVLGVEKSLHVGAGGRALLSQLKPAELDAYLDQASFERLAPNTPTDPARIRELVAGVRERGYEISREEGATGVVGVAAPLALGPDQEQAALILTIPLHRFTEDHQTRVVRAILAAAASLNATAET